MKSSLPSVTKFAALSAAVLLGALAPSYASDNHAKSGGWNHGTTYNAGEHRAHCNQATPIGAGSGTGGATPILYVDGTPQPATASLQFYLVQLPNGALKGKGKIKVDGGSVEFDITSYMLVNGLLSAAGPATEVQGTPVFGFFKSPVAVGETVFFNVRDGGDHAPDAFIEGVIPGWLVAGAPPGFLTTIQQISLPEFAGVPPDSVMRPVTHGKFEIND